MRQCALLLLLLLLLIHSAALGLTLSIGRSGGVDGAQGLYQSLYEHEKWGGTREAGETSGEKHSITTTQHVEKRSITTTHPHHSCGKAFNHHHPSPPLMWEKRSITTTQHVGKHSLLLVAK
eukprot:scaffold226639_cov43-Tisochrysis_lutea.AAC.1